MFVFDYQLFFSYHCTRSDKRDWLTNRWPRWSLTNRIWHSDTRVCINQLFCRCGFIYSDFHCQSVCFLSNGSQQDRI